MRRKIFLAKIFIYKKANDRNSHAFPGRVREMKNMKFPFAKTLPKATFIVVVAVSVFS